MTPLDDILLATAALLTALGVIGTAMWKGYKTVKRIDQAIGIDDDGHSLSWHLTAMQERIGKVENLLMPAGRDPLPQRVDDLEDEVHRTKNAVERIGSKMDTLEKVVLADRRHNEKK